MLTVLRRPFNYTINCAAEFVTVSLAGPVTLSPIAGAAGFRRADKAYVRSVHIDCMDDFRFFAGLTSAITLKWYDPITPTDTTIYAQTVYAGTNPIEQLFDWPTAFPVNVAYLALDGQAISISMWGVNAAMNGLTRQVLVSFLVDHTLPLI